MTNKIPLITKHFATDPTSEWFLTMINYRSRQLFYTAVRLFDTVVAKLWPLVLSHLKVTDDSTNIHSFVYQN